MIIRWCEIVCDTCGNAEHYQGSISSAGKQFRNRGGIITRNKKHYCAKECYDNNFNRQRPRLT